MKKPTLAIFACFFLLLSLTTDPAQAGDSSGMILSLEYSTYLGGGGYDCGKGIEVDSEGYVYIAGYTNSANYPTENPYQTVLAVEEGSGDIFVTKLSTTGSTIVYSTYLGGDQYEEAYGISVENGEAYITGYTESENFPIGNPYQAALGGEEGSGDAFVSKLSSSGSTLIYSTYLGGDQEEEGYEISVQDGEAYITGYTESENFPIGNPYQAVLGGEEGQGDAFVTKISSSGSALIYSTYLGGSGEELGAGIVVDSSGFAYIAGYTDSPDYPTENPYQTVNGGEEGSVDVFVTKLSSTGSLLIYSTYLGGDQEEEAYGISLQNNAAYVTGYTTSENFPIENAYQSSLNGSGDVFITKLAPSGSTLIYSTYLGGGGLGKRLWDFGRERRSLYYGLHILGEFPGKECIPVDHR